jgi:hypothetical protein
VGLKVRALPLEPFILPLFKGFLQGRPATVSETVSKVVGQNTTRPQRTNSLDGKTECND